MVLGVLTWRASLYHYKAYVNISSIYPKPLVRLPRSSVHFPVGWSLPKSSGICSWPPDLESHASNISKHTQTVIRLSSLRSQMCP
ncbi:hypothetical protein HBI24_039590 [Parastagonospora nodorum]|nr:hypothetical protein HBI10_039680 [Parastagonospora nodorum]KAH4030652.1 hypothetical protein HBI13_023130 [Parastagonospora nodorum]KAH4056077.1 hypothetical protein HBH49_048850 [Parastagonospora nodorum]KAH4109581.1 hypothetical protein HBH46_030900 [Parastagonospora nodorum]KAH4196306.1 hypothetical protein HBI95_190670 [Parastagonospora nodorum]